MSSNLPFDSSLPEDFSVFASDPQSLTCKAAARFQVTPQQFSSWLWQMRHQLQEEADFGKGFTFSLSASEKDGFTDLKELFKAGVTPYYAALMDENNPNCPIRLQALPRAEEKEDRLGCADPLEEILHSPVPEVVHLYPDRVAFCVAMLCPVYCRYCYRKRRDEEEGLHYNRRIIDKGIEYIASNSAIKDVLITGGDPFIASDSSIEQLLKRLREIPHIEIIRFGTRTPVTLPYRVTRRLGQILAKYHPVWVNTHFNCEEELTPEACQAIANLADNGIPVGNQSVLLRGVNDSLERMKGLCRALVRNRVRPYYLFHPHLVEGTEHLRSSVKTGLEIIKGLRGQVSGFAIPTYIVDSPSGKIPIYPEYRLGSSQEDLLLENNHGEIWRERGAWT